MTNDYLLSEARYQEIMRVCEYLTKPTYRVILQLFSEHERWLTSGEVAQYLGYHRNYTQSKLVTLAHLKILDMATGSSRNEYKYRISSARLHFLNTMVFLYCTKTNPYT